MRKQKVQLVVKSTLWSVVLLTVGMLLTEAGVTTALYVLSGCIWITNPITCKDLVSEVSRVLVVAVICGVLINAYCYLTRKR